jgi:toxin YoeB
MNRRLSFITDAWNEYLHCQTEDKKTLKRINDIDRNPFSGIGKPEPLKGNRHGYWSRRIDEANRNEYTKNKKRNTSKSERPAKGV